ARYAEAASAPKSKQKKKRQQRQRRSRKEKLRIEAAQPMQKANGQSSPVVLVAYRKIEDQNRKSLSPKPLQPSPPKQPGSVQEVAGVAPTAVLQSQSQLNVFNPQPPSALKRLRPRQQQHRGKQLLSRLKRCRSKRLTDGGNK
ncbi:hypothetical protein BOX15_Mlig032836g1, partial [Macrostomum lignano]